MAGPARPSATRTAAARYDDRFDLVAGVFASDADRSRTFARNLGIADDRRYGTWDEMAEREAKRDDGIEAVTICTPNAHLVDDRNKKKSQSTNWLCEKDNSRHSPFTNFLFENE